ncbi:MAG: putative nucleotidyltransferase substrate binding domain-containing protein [Desulfuromonadaceae bacterium]|nr:putative nucleotidyltransferase substrate binding domain-containing protein [Desulfuromonadaceae bacterium]MDD5104761.1 putative nucleotidyltransferase substrate binding domain-containing protein [Desulfuromonadaceae bacterium]
MNILLSAKGIDVTTWRGAESFAATYRQAVLDQAAFDHTSSVETVLAEACHSLEATISAHQQHLEKLQDTLDQLNSATDLRTVTTTFYEELYRHFTLFRSAPVFYQLSGSFLRRLSTVAFTRSAEQRGLFASQLPEMKLFALGPAGRDEFSPFSQLQMLVVHGDVAESQRQNINLFCHALHAVFDAAGLSLDPIITPRNPHWCGTQAECQHRYATMSVQPGDGGNQLAHLADIASLHPENGESEKFNYGMHAALKRNHPAMMRLLGQMAAYPNGIGLTGRLKLEKRGSDRGQFRLHEHGMQPLAAALSALALIKKSPAVGSCARIHDLLGKRELDVDMAERMLHTWHHLHDVQLMRECASYPRLQPAPPLVNPELLTAASLAALKKNLESVALIQRYVEVVFSETRE